MRPERASRRGARGPARSVQWSGCGADSAAWLRVIRPSRVPDTREDGPAPSAVGVGGGLAWPWRRPVAADARPERSPACSTSSSFVCPLSRRPRRPPKADPSEVKIRTCERRASKGEEWRPRPARAGPRSPGRLPDALPSAGGSASLRSAAGRGKRAHGLPPSRGVSVSRLLLVLILVFVFVLRPLCSPTAVVMRAVGGEIGAASTLAPKVGPLGLVRVAAAHSSLAPRVSFLPLGA